MEKLKNYRRSICVFMILLVIVGVCLYCYYAPGPGMLLPLTEVAGFNRKISLLSTVDYENVILTDFSREGYLTAHVISELTKYVSDDDSVYFPAIAIRPDCSRLS